MSNRRGYFTPQYQALRLTVFHRDGWACQFPGCGKRGTKKQKLQAHHIVPYSWGGETTLENLVSLCRIHHQVVDTIIGVRKQKKGDISYGRIRETYTQEAQAPQSSSA